MLAALIIVFREVFEAGIIIGIVMAATRGLAGSRRWIAGGIAVGVVGSLGVALFIDAVSAAFSGVGQELLNASILSVAVLMLVTHNIWMARHGREMAKEVRITSEAVLAHRKSIAALAVVASTAVLREGSETALFLYGAATAGGASTQSILTGGVLGLLGGAALTGLTYVGLVRFTGGLLFPVTSVLITFIAASMAAQAVFFLQQAGYLMLLDTTAWNSSALLPEHSVPGALLHSLFGYAEQPSWMQIAVYVCTLISVIFLTHSARKDAWKPR
jgi:high-affinity iron transporter